MSKTITFTTNIGCRVNCKFCPQDDIMQNFSKKENLSTLNFGNPSMMTYQKFVTMLEKIPKELCGRGLKTLALWVLLIYWAIIILASFSQ